LPLTQDGLRYGEPSPTGGAYADGESRGIAGASNSRKGFRTTTFDLDAAWSLINEFDD
jgi:hypothetical protein